MKTRRVVKKITKRVGRAFGVSDLTDQLNILNEKIDKLDQKINYNIELLQVVNDITKVPNATGLVRDLQLGNFQLLMALKKICEKHKIEFRLEFGSLLGAVRHGGYIPWDDDIDISMMREDYDKLLSILDDETAGTDLWYIHSEIIRFYYGKTPLQIDIFPNDFYHKTKMTTNEQQELLDYLMNTHLKYIKFNWSKSMTQERVIKIAYSQINELRKNTLGDDITKTSAIKKHPMICFGLEVAAMEGRKAIHNYDWIYPLKTIKFMGEEMPIPNQPEKLLAAYYGDYMSWPGALHSKHPDIDSRMTPESMEIVQKIITGKQKLLG